MVPCSSMILALPPTCLDQPLAGPLAFLLEVRADEGDVVDARLGQVGIDAAVDQEHRDAGLLGRHHRRDQRLLLARRQEDDVDLLGDHRVDVGDLLGGRAGGVGVDQRPAALLGLFLHAGGLRQAPGIVALGLGEADLVGVLLRERGQPLRAGAHGQQRHSAAPAASPIVFVSAFRCLHFSEPALRRHPYGAGTIGQSQADGTGARSIGLEQVALAAHGAHDGWSGRVRLEFLAQAGDADVDAAVVRARAAGGGRARSAARATAPGSGGGRRSPGDRTPWR